MTLASFALLTRSPSNLVSIGFFDQAFEIICLEAFSEPLLFDVHNVEILGKVVGVGEATPNKSGNFSVHSIDLEDK